MKSKKKIGLLLFPIYMRVCEISWIYRLLLFFKRVCSKKTFLYRKMHLLGGKELVEKVIDSKYIPICSKKERKVWEKRYYGEEKTKYSSFMSPEIYLLEVNNAIVIGNDEGVIVREYYINDYLRDNKGILFYYGKIIGDKYIEVMYEEPKRSVESAISLLTPEANNYWHFVNELLGKIYCFIDDKRYENLPILVNASILRNDNLRYLLCCALNHSTQRTIIGIENEETVNVQKLVYISRVSWTPLHVKRDYVVQSKDFMLSDETMKFVRNQIYQNITEDNSRKKISKVYLSRKKIANNRLLEEENVEYTFKKHGFEVYYPETMTVEEQICLMKNADIVAGCAGAAMTNIVFCKPTTKVMIIVPKEHKSMIWSNYGGQVDLDVIFLDAVIVKKEVADSNDQYRIDINYLSNILKEIDMESDDNEL